MKLLLLLAAMALLITGVAIASGWHSTSTGAGSGRVAAQFGGVNVNDQANLPANPGQPALYG